MPNIPLQIVNDEFLTSIDHCYEFRVNLQFDCFIYRPMCSHMGFSRENLYFLDIENSVLQTLS